ncbi:hydantoinase B/oxoprolinase family protein [Conexibacter stalactiti]|uniref:Hydantoinase B/oxoprolinase family protein n=1 Tax=Conexibacter stalactiti TaxID=1940611 RepID=A0ABU4HID5_9ACTN|nr:hydantoinase B/oxoprolinase family protein [Conexibacter stalactiti]MDW5593076.1 hydantoinase B/oxoprolinase family protein [Conexibacter stalactiti]MEC5033717.1 hydantoinase B/oxoprolinase family protein [Conexibacter stalactiti]
MGSEVDPITLSVIMSRFNAIVTEMTRVVEKSAWTTILALAHDYSCAIYDAVPRQVSMHEALPIMTSAMHFVVGEIADAFEGDVHDGDVFLCNDPYSGNTHVGDYVTAAPVFADGKLVFWSVTSAHQMDTGAFVPSSVAPSALNVYQEGITIPPTRLVERGTMRDDLLRLLLSNLRYAELIEGDLRALTGSIEKGRQRLRELCDEYGTEVVLAYVEEMISYSSRRAAQEFLSMPDGRYTAEGWVDSDGLDAEHIPVKVAVTIDGDRAHVDYTGSGPQARGGTNGSFATSQAAARVPFLHYIASDIPHNHGVLSHIDVFAPEGTICNARFPASTSVGTTVPSDLMQEVVSRALVAAMPDRVPAGGVRCGWNQTISGKGADGASEWGFMLFNGTGGGPAAKGADGWPHWVTASAAAGEKILPIEQLELLFPVRIERCEIEPESMGFGQWLGGPGIRCVVRPLVDERMYVVSHGDGAANPPHGAMGGTPGCGGGQYVHDLPTGARRFISVNGVFTVDCRSELYVGVSTGGGGWGQPYERAADQVRRDVRDGVVSRHAAAEVFGVILTDDEDPVVDIEATTVKRDELRRTPGPVVSPTHANASTWLGENMREGDEYFLNPRL